MSTPKKSKRARQPETDLFGDPVRSAPPLRKAVARPNGRGWCIAVREPASTTYLHKGIYETEGGAWQAIRDGVGAEPREDREEMRLEVRFSVRRGLQ